VGNYAAGAITIGQPVQFFFDGLDDGTADRHTSKDTIVGPLTRFGSTSDGMRTVRAFEKADLSLRRMLAQHVEEMVRAASR
jgi:hypothetical protein